jgi:hypothetical protein
MCVAITTYLHATGWRVRGLILGREKKLFSSATRPERLWDSPSLLFNGDWRSLPGIRRPEREVCHAPSLDEVKNEWSYTSAPHVCLDDVYRNNGTCYLYQNISWICTNRRRHYFWTRCGCETFDIVEDMLEKSLSTKCEYHSVGVLYAGHIMQAELSDDFFVVFLNEDSNATHDHYLNS